MPRSSKAIILLFHAALLCGAQAGAADFDIAIHRGNGLANLFTKLRGGQNVTIVWLGGSITQGWGYRDLTMNWFQQHYPNRVQSVNAGWGGTGSLIGALRYARDALDHGPDAVFIEFAVNDLPEDPIPFIERNYDGMVQHTWQTSDRIDLCFIETMAWYLEGAYLAGNLPNTVEAHYNIADYYGIPSVNVGWALYEHVLAGTPLTDLLPDRTHPNAAGSQIYADALIAYLDSERVRNSTSADHLLLRQHSDFPVVDSIVYRLYDVNLPPGWTKVASGFGVNGYIESNTPGATLTLPVNGSAAILKVITGPDGGNVSVSVDGGPFYSAQIHQFGSHFVWAVPAVKWMLPPGDHTLTIRVDTGIARLVNVETAQTQEPVDPGAPGDFDIDGDVDQTDFGLIQACFSGAGIRQDDPSCARALLDNDADVDQADVLIFEQCVSGANVPAAIDCAL